MTNEIKNKIRSYEKRKPITDKRFKFSNDLIKRAAYVGNGKLPDKRSDINTESLQLWIRPNGIKTFYASKKVSMFNKEKVKMELNSTSKKMMRFDLNYEAAKEMLPQILKDMAAPKEETKDDSLFDNLARIQTVHKETNKKYFRLIEKFKEKTNCPVIINTSFNVRGEPIVNTPLDAFNCFMGTELDKLVIGNCYLEKKFQNIFLKKDYKMEFELD